MYFNHDDEMPRTTVLGETGKFLVDFEIKDRHPFIHLEFGKLTPDTYKGMVYAIDNLKVFLGAVGYPHVFVVLRDDQPTLKKLAKKLGFTHSLSFDDHEIFQLYIKEPDNYEGVD